MTSLSPRRLVIAAAALIMIMAHLGALGGAEQALPGAASGPPTPGSGAQEIILPNGFRVLVVEDPRVPRVAASIWYRIGALQEQLGEHGSTHFLEHAIHQGTTTVGTTNFEAEKPLLKAIYETEQELIAEWNRERNRLRERRIFFEELDWPTTSKMTELRRRLYQLEDQISEYREFWAEYLWYRRSGGLMRHTDPVPATTGNEYMDIDIDLPKERLEIFFRLEADRMANAVLRGWEAQRFTVLEQILNRWSRHETRLVEALQGASGTAHPVYTLSAWGHLRDFAYFNRANMLRMYDDYFVPNNTTLSLVGAITVAEARALAEKYFGRVPRGPEPPSRMDVEAEPPPGGSVRLDWLEPLEPRVFVRFRIPAVGHPDRPVFDAMAALLRGRHGMFGQRRRTSPFGVGPVTVSVNVAAGRAGTPSTLTLSATVERDDQLPGVEHVILDTVEDLREGRIDAAALVRARKELRLEWARTRADRDELAYELGRTQVIDDWKGLDGYMAAREAASAEDIKRVARLYLTPVNRIVATTRANPDTLTAAARARFTN